MLRDKYDFNTDDILQQYVGLSKSGVKYYSSVLGEKPECQGGKLICEKRDLNPKHLDVELDCMKLVPVVLCLECENKAKCKLGKNAKIGYYFLIIIDEKRPRDVDLKRKKIKNKNIIIHLEETKLNIWNEIQFDRR